MPVGLLRPRQLPFYWGIADRYVLFDRFFIRAVRHPGQQVVRPAAPPPGGSGAVPAGWYGKRPTIFDQLQHAGISWKFYVQNYDPRQTYQNASLANPQTQTARVPLVNYARFTRDPALRRHIADLDQYYRDLSNGTLPAVAYIASSSGDNERSARTITAGQHLVRNMVTQLTQSRYWNSSALLVSYDGSGGWFDHVRPPGSGPGAFGFRVPALLVSAHAVRGQVKSHRPQLRKRTEIHRGELGLPRLPRATPATASPAPRLPAGPRPGTVRRRSPPPGGHCTPRARSAAPVAAVYGFYGTQPPRASPWWSWPLAGLGSPGAVWPWPIESA